MDKGLCRVLSTSGNYLTSIAESWSSMFGLTLLVATPMALLSPSIPLLRAPWPAVARTPPPQLSADKQMSSDELVTYAEVTDDFRALMGAALKRIDKSRAMSGKDKYETVEGMIDAYVVEADKAGLGWTRADAESEVVR